MDYKDFELQKDQEELHFWYRAKKNLIFNLLSSIFKNHKQNRLILNIGCGTGTELKVIKGFGSVIALDKNQNALNEVNKLNFQTIQADIQEYKLPEEHYEAICCFDVLDHLRNDQKVINNIYQALKPGGYLICTVPAFQYLFSSHDIALEHCRRYSKKEIESKLEEVGFKILKINYWNVLLFPLIFVIRISKKLVNLVKSKEIKYKTEMNGLNKYLNRLLFGVLNVENNKLLLNLPKPFGLSIYGIAQKNKIN